MEKARTCITKITLNERTYHKVSFQPTLVNFFYGGNGAGKSTIAKAIKAKRGLTWDSPASEDYRLMVFNEDYIRDNIQSYGNIPGVFTLTEEDATVRKDLDDAIRNRNETETILRKAESAASEIVNQELTLGKQYWGKVWDKTLQWTKTDFPKATAGFGNSKEKFFNALYKVPRVQGDYAALLANYAAVFETTAVQYQPYSMVPDSLPASELLRKPIISRSDTEFAKFVCALETWTGYVTGMTDTCPQTAARFASARWTRPLLKRVSLPATMTSTAARWMSCRSLCLHIRMRLTEYTPS